MSRGPLVSGLANPVRLFGQTLRDGSGRSSGTCAIKTCIG